MRTRFKLLGCAAGPLCIFACAWHGIPQRASAEEKAPSPPAALSREAREAADRVRTKVVVLKTSRGGRAGAATGFLARPRLVITAGHAVSPMSTVTAWVNGVSYRAEVVATHPAHDLAILGLRAPDLLLKPVELADTARELAGGESLVILAGPSQPRNATGDPAGRIPIPGAFRERVTLRLPNGNTGDLLKMDARVERGDSGSPVIRVKDGKVVGILSSRELPDTAGVSHFAYAVPVEELHPWLESASAPPLRRDDEEFYLLDLPMR